MRGRVLVAGACVSLGGWASAAGSVEVGLERLEADGGAPLRGRRVGLVVHAASVTADGRHAIDVLRGQGVQVVRLFAPEHGLLGRAAAGETVRGGVDPRTRLPVVSLHGAAGKTKPAPEDLRGLDALVVDLQDAGVRFYTYAATTILCLEAAAEAGIDLVVLDRPNPLGGDLLEGPEADPMALRTLVSLAPGPLIHGLTVGEMARYVNARLPRPSRLTVVPMHGWNRGMLWSDTGRDWVPPSPNLVTADAATAYPGVCLLEATNVSEGRGTESPFLLLGAPWLRTEAVLASLSVPGFAFEAARFTPLASEAAPDPKFGDAACAGVRVHVTDPRAARPYALGVALLATLRRLQPEFAWRHGGLALDRLVGTRRLRDALERGDGVEAIVKADAAAIETFRRERRAILLY